MRARSVTDREAPVDRDATKEMSPDAFADFVLSKVNERRLCDHPFFDRLERGEVTLEDLQRSCYQMMWYYNNSVRNIGLALSSHMDNEARHAIVENVIDEETEFRCGEAAHYVLALKFARAVGFDTDEIEEANRQRTLRPDPQLEYAMESALRIGFHEDGALVMAAGMVGAEALLPDMYTRLVEGLKKFFSFSDDELDIFITHIEGDTQHMEEGRDLVRSYATSAEERDHFMSLALFTRDRFYECWDAIWRAGERKLPQSVSPSKA
jgi:pyrroloquinoline quinone (PQQ) biosynthesis protein C